MTEQEINQSSLIDDYVSGALSGEELVSFEERLLWDDGLVEQVIAAEAFRKGLREHGAGFRARAARPRVARWFSTPWAPKYAFAASVLLAVSVTVNVMQVMRTSPEPSDPVLGGTSPQVIRLIATRSNDLREIVFDGERSVVLTAEPVSGFDEYRLTLSGASDPGQPIALQVGPAGAQQGPPSIAVPGAAVTPGEYVLSLEAGLSGSADFQAIGEYRFRAVRP